MPASSELVGSEIHHRLGPYRVAAATSFGPRLVGLSYLDGPEILAQLSPQVSIETPGVGTFRFRGGHRIWVGPEVAEISHVPDENTCRVTTADAGLAISAPVDAAGFEKHLSVRWEGARLVVDHRIRWTGEHPVEAAPWAITQLPLGGIALLPITGPDRGSALQPDASLVVWPYTSLDDPRLEWRDRSVLIHADPGPALKLGTGPAPGGLGYLRDGFLFTKHLPPATGVIPDRGAVGQVYVGKHFCELESVGPLVTLEPGGEVSHREEWTVTECPGVDELVTGSEDWGMS